jgi:uncharacterized protein (DUF3820 family)
MSIEDNIAASQSARVILDLAMEEAMNHQGPAALHYWLSLLKSVARIVPESHHPWRTLPSGVVPMDKAERQAFEDSAVMFGKHAGERVGDVPLEYLEWLDSQYDFRQQLKRYLATDLLQRQMAVDED